MTMLETNCSQNSIDMSYREFMMCMWKLDYRDSKVGCSKSMLDYVYRRSAGVVIINTSMQ